MLVTANAMRTLRKWTPEVCATYNFTMIDRGGGAQLRISGERLERKFQTARP